MMFGREANIHKESTESKYHVFEEIEDSENHALVNEVDNRFADGDRRFFDGFAFTHNITPHSIGIVFT
jgi:hypothetical protein